MALPPNIVNSWRWGLTLNRIIDALLASATRADGMNRGDSEILAHQSRKRDWRNW